MRWHWLTGLFFAMVMNASATAAGLKLLQIQADALGLELTLGRADATVLGAAMLAGVPLALS